MRCLAGGKKIAADIASVVSERCVVGREVERDGGTRKPGMDRMSHLDEPPPLED